MRAVQAEQTVLVLDFGSQYTQLIARRVRENRVYSVVHPFDFPIEKIRELAPRAIILSGGPESVYAESAPYCSREIFDLGVPILGICYGMQLTAFFLDGKVEAASEREYGRAEIEVAETSEISRVKAAQAVDTVIEGLRNALARGQRIELRGFGVFQVKQRKKGIGRNPKTGVEVKIPPGNTIRFKPGKELRNLL